MTINNHVHPEEWLSDVGLTERGKEARHEYEQYCNYMQSLKLPSFQIARAKYFLQRQNYWTLPDGYALPPHTINVCPNNICNYRCHYCDFGQKETDTFYHKYNIVDNKKKIELTLDICKSIVDQSAWFKPIIRASFREPLLYKDIIPLAAHTKEKGLPFWLLTNGYTLPKHAKDLVTIGVDSIRLSLDGPPAIHNEVAKVKDAYERMMEGVHMLFDEMALQKKQIDIGFYFTINEANYDTMLQTVEALDKEGFLKKSFMSFQWLLYTTKNMAAEHNKTDAEFCGGVVNESTVCSVDIHKMDLKLMSEQYINITQRYPAAEGYRIHFRPSFDLKDLEKYRDTEDFPVDEPRCRVLWYNMNVNPEGEVKTFHHCLLNVAGNVYQNNVMDIWNGATLRDQRVKLASRGAYKGCARCWGVYSLLEDKRRTTTA